MATTEAPPTPELGWAACGMELRRVLSLRR